MLTISSALTGSKVLWITGPAPPVCMEETFCRTRHFVHQRANGCSGSGETFQHLWAKAEVLHACADAGWQASTEVSGDGWRADVLASRGSARVAFEVQWSSQDEDAFGFRQKRYAVDGIRGCWLFRGEVPSPAQRELPIFVLRPRSAPMRKAIGSSKAKRTSTR